MVCCLYMVGLGIAFNSYVPKLTWRDHHPRSATLCFTSYLLINGGRGIWTLFLLVKESRLFHWATGLLANPIYLLKQENSFISSLSIYTISHSLPFFLALLNKDMPYQGKAILSSSKREKKIIHCFHTLIIPPMFR